MASINNYHNSKYFIHKIDLNILDDLINEKCLGFIDNNHTFINRINKNDFIILSMDFDNKNIFFAYTNVKNVSKTKKKLYDYYNSSKILKLKGIKFFNKPFINDNYRFDNTDYLEITKEEFNYLKPDKKYLSKNPPIFPNTIEKITIGDFIKNTNEFLDCTYPDLKNNSSKKEALLNEILLYFDININEKQYFNLDKSYNCFMHYINPNNMINFNKKFYINENNNSLDLIRDIKPNDYSLLFTKKEDKFYFFATAKIDYNLFNNYELYLKYFNPPNTIKFKDINRFSKYNFSSFIPKDIGEYFIRKLSNDDIKSINREFFYLEEFYIKNYKDFILKSCNILIKIIKNNVNDENNEYIEIKKFLVFLNIFLRNAGIKFSQYKLNKFFSQNAHYLNFKYSYSRDPDLILEIKINERKIKQCSHIHLDKINW